MATMMKWAAMVVAVGLLLGSCAASSPRPEGREPAMLLDAPAHANARVLVKPEQLFDE